MVVAAWCGMLRRLLVDDWRSGDLWSWHVPSGRISRVATSQTTGINVYVARETMAERLRKGGGRP